MTVRLWEPNTGRAVPRPTDTGGSWDWPDDPETWPKQDKWTQPERVEAIPDSWVITWATRRDISQWWAWPA